MLFSNDVELKEEQGIFPMIVFQKDSQTFKCKGTSFFINGLGIFVTARHVIANEITDNKMIFIVQGLRDGKLVSRIVTSLCIHPLADIAVGEVGPALDSMTAKPVEFEVAPNCRLSFKRMENGTEVMGYGYPRTEKQVNANLTTFSMKGVWAKGIIDDYHSEGMSWLQNKCYQTTMSIESGCSGGPVFKDGCVVGINSSSFEMSLGEAPISFITPVDYLLDLQLPFDDKLLSIADIIKKGAIIADR